MSLHGFFFEDKIDLLSNAKILVLIELHVFADDNLDMSDIKLFFFFDKTENIVGKMKKMLITKVSTLPTFSSYSMSSKGRIMTSTFIT